MRELIRRLSFSDRVSDDSSGVPRGCVPVLVVGDGDGDDECERLVSPTFVSDPPTMRELIRRLSFVGPGERRQQRRAARVRAGAGGGDGDGGDECERCVVRVETLRRPSLAALLEMAAQEFGYKQKGILRVPCAIHQFRQALTTAAVSKGY
uniref:Uncharacterized protein n=1 Tax=Aegilops tauschii TaxID=37682 RepID=M8C874_AEGTA